MKNLMVHRQHRRGLQFMKDAAKDNRRLLEIKCAVNANNDDLYVLSDNQLYTLPTDCKRDISSLNITKYSENSKVIGLEYCIITQALYCAYDCGDIVSIDITNESHFEYEIIAKFDSGLRYMQLSPDHEIITAVTGAGTVVTIVSDFQVISEVNLYSLDFGEKQFISVGWGRKDTQFHGSEGKAAAKIKPEQADIDESDDGLPRITWRGDGTLFAVSFLHDTTKIRQFKVFNREGILQYTSEPINGLEKCLAWKPSGSLIAATQKLINKHAVVLFEKNGLKHREFSLPFGTKEVIVKDLFWAPNSDILAITCEQLETSSTILQLWTESNYHWYLKQTIVFPMDNLLIYATWSAIGRYNQKELILLTLKEIISCSFNRCVNHSRGKTLNDKAVIGVIGGRETLITGFRVGLVPPPLAHQSLQTQEPINAIIFAPDVNDKKSWINSNIFCTVSCSNSLTFFKQIMGEGDSYALTYKAFKSYNIEGDVSSIDKHSIYTMHHFVWLAKNIMLCSKTTDNCNLLCILFLDEVDSEDNEHLTIRDTYAVNDPIEHIVPSPDANIAYVIANNSVLKYTQNVGLTPTNIELKDPCYQVEVIKNGAKHIIVALSYTNCFSIDGREVANNITSFYIHSEFLLLTTLQHTLICIPLNKTGMEQLTKHDLTIKPWESGINEKPFAEINIRRVERGSYIITAISQDSKVILQMPRGNLECIQPRALSLHIIKLYLNNCNYLVAFDIMRKQRINLNLIYDHNPQLFVHNAEKFVEDIVNPNWLSLFLSELQDEDVTTTMYASCYPRCPARSMSQNDEKNMETKVDKVCKILRDVMKKQHDANNLIQPILMTMVKNQKSSGLQLALQEIKQMRTTEDLQNASLGHHPLPMSSTDALKYLLYLVDIDVLYNTALGMYDFELTMFIASKSQKDPKEYIPFFNNLKKLDKNYMKYSIDMHLKRYENALEHLSRIPSKFEECLDLIRNQSLYTKARKLFKKDSIEFKRVTGVFAEYLFSKKMYQEAAIMFYKSEDFNKALDAHMLAGNWQDVIILSVKLKLSPVDSHTLYKELAERLKTDRRYKDAAEVLRYYLNDAEEAIALLCEGRCWKHAIRIAHDIQRLDLNETHVIPGINEHAEHIMLQLHRLEQDFVTHKSRLGALRAEINKRRMSTNNEIICNDGPISNREIVDFLSDMSSVAGSASSCRSQMSTVSGRSYRSSKNRRKQERKLFSLKEGGMFEDLGLIYALYQIISNVYKDKDDWSQLIQALIHFEFDECAEKLQNKIYQFFQLIENNKAEIWNKSAPTSLAEMGKMATYTPAQLQEITAYLKLVEPYIMHPPPETDAIHVLDVF